MIKNIILRCKNNINENLNWKINDVEYKKLKLKWSDKNLSLSIFDINPSNKKNEEKLEIKNMSIIKHITKTKYDFVVLGIGYVDYHKILKSFNRANLVQRKMIDSIHSNLKKVNGQYISIIQQCLLLNIPHFCLGRDRLTELTSIGTAIFSNPKEIFSLLYYFIINSEENAKGKNGIIENEKNKSDKENNLQNISPNFYRALIVENALYLTYNLHATLLKIIKSKYYIPFDNERSSNNSKKKNLKQRILSFFNETTHDQINKLRMQIRKTELYGDFQIPTEKKDISILIICDSVCVDYFYNLIQKKFSVWYNISPFYNELFNLEKKNTYKFTLSLFLFIIAPISWTITFLIKYLYYLWIEYFTKGKVITVGGDVFFKNSQLIDLDDNDMISKNNNDDFLKSLNNNKVEFETVSLLGGLLQWFKNKSRN
ncbi:conserved Plasmodium protein, unknown function [Plasmodium gallinaceum]|uniref:Uncharacterized protein n=1 Tax=Plasmodium gallinaceum TaxID=5849 RepID=A0A1J1GQC2_PLAGA|nr:conserved Plasmodium protein, unknown function [Plasmodium gallinaceum]CRG94703.1 conserved Plasmodium protein, unknown function [Plasmodium gallinaceum]